MQSWILPAALLGATVLHAVLDHFRRHTLTDAERADLLDRIAEGAAAVIAAAFPNKAWAELVQLVVQRILQAPGVPTTSKQAVENAATAALMKYGKAPNAR